MAMSKEAVKDKMKDQNVVVLNILSESDFLKLHITGSENLPSEGNADFAGAVDEKYGKGNFFITYGAGFNSVYGSNAAKALQEKGFKAADYAGGIQEWSQAGFPTEGTEAKVDAPVVAAK